MKLKAFSIKVFSVFFVKGLGTASLFFINMLIARRYSPKEAGMFFWLLNLIMVFGSVATMGCHEYLIRIVGANYKKKKWDVINTALSRALYITMVANIFFFSILILFTNELSMNIFENPTLKLYLNWIAVASLFYSTILISSAAIQGRGQASLASFTQNTITSILFLLSLSIAFFSHISISIFSCFLIYIACLFISSLFSLIQWFKLKPMTYILKPGFGDKQFIKTTSTLFLITLMGLFVQWSGMSISILYLSTQEIAYYAIAQRVGTIMTFLLIAINFVVAPRFSYAFADNNINEIKRTALLSCRYLTLFSIPIFLFLFFFPAPVLGLFGPEYSSSTDLLKIILLGQLVNVISGSVGYLLLMTGHEGAFRNAITISGIFSIITTFLLTSLYGAIGCAVSFSLSIAFHNFLSAWFVKKKLGFWVYNIYE